MVAALRLGMVEKMHVEGRADPQRPALAQVGTVGRLVLQAVGETSHRAPQLLTLLHLSIASSAPALPLLASLLRSWPGAQLGWQDDAPS